MGYFACHSNYISYMVCCTKYNETCMGEDSTAPENKNEFQKRQHYQSYTIKTFPCQRNRVKNDLYMSWWNSKVVFVASQTWSVLVEAEGRFPPWKAATLPGEAVFHGQILLRGQLPVWRSTHGGVIACQRPRGSQFETRKHHLQTQTTQQHPEIERRPRVFQQHSKRTFAKEDVSMLVSRYRMLLWSHSP